MPLLRYNITANSSLTTKVSLDAAALDWEVEQLPDVVESTFGSGIDAIVYVRAADLLFLGHLTLALEWQTLPTTRHPSLL